MSKTFELSNKASKDGKRKFSLILHRIFPDSCVIDGIGTQYNDNGITWLRKYTEDNLESIKGMSLRVEFADDTRTTILGHGYTEAKDGLPVYENASMVGTFDYGEIAECTENGETFEVCKGYGHIDEMCYKAFCEKLDKDIADGNAPYGSVEIYKSPDENGIVYENGYHDYGRIPKKYLYSGHALLGIEPADKKSRLLELNTLNKEEEIRMTDEELKVIVESAIKDANDNSVELNAKITELNEVIGQKDNTIAELNASVTQIQAALDDLKAQHDTYWAEREILEQELAKAKVAEKLGEMNSKLAKFSEEELKCVETELNSYKEKPLEGDIDAIVSKVCTNIVMKEKEEEEARISEQNAKKITDVDDIFSEVTVRKEDNESIF